jgi:hypothetical protein
MFTANFQGSYTGLFTLDTATYEIEQVGVILVDRVANAWVPDLNCHIVLDPDDNTAQVLTVTWYNGFGGSIQVQKTDLADWSILSDPLTVLTPTTINLPGQLTGSYGAYDAMMAWDGEKWLIAYSITQDTNFAGDPFYPALASTTDFSSFTLIGADTALAGQGYEGTKLYVVNDELYVTAGGPVSGSRNARVYDDTFAYLGNLDATFVSGTTIPPHAMPWAMGDSFWLITFTDDLVAGTAFTQGNFVLQQAQRYSSPGACTSTPFEGYIAWPYLDFGAFGLDKMLESVDVTATGEYSISIGYSQTNFSLATTPYTVDGDTLPGSPVPIPVMGPSFQLRLTFSGEQDWEWMAANMYLNRTVMP